MDKPYVKASTRIYPFFDRLSSSSNLELPQTIEIHLSNVCNNSCKFCFYHDTVNEKNKISFLPYDKILETLECFKNRKNHALVLSGGGEPTLHPKFHDIIEAAYNLGFDIGVITNGIHYNQKIEDALLKTAWVKFSLHTGSSIQYNKIIGRYDINIFDRIQQNIKTFVSSKTSKTKVSTGCVINKINESDDDILSYFNNSVYNLGVDYVLFRGYMGDNINLKITRSQHDFFQIEKKINFLAAQAGVFSNFSSFVKGINNKEESYNDICPIVKAGMIAAITTNGEVHVCLPGMQCNLFRPIGSILYDNFRNIWQSNKHYDIINSALVNKCPSCKYKKTIPLIKNISSDTSMLEQQIIKAKKDPHWRFL